MTTAAERATAFAEQGAAEHRAAASDPIAIYRRNLADENRRSLPSPLRAFALTVSELTGWHRGDDVGLGAAVRIALREHNGEVNPS